MATVRPFCAVRPTKEKASLVAALPYDVMTSDEARVMVKDNPYSFLHVDKAEIDLDPSIDLYDEQVYAKAAENLSNMQKTGVTIQDITPCYYVYRQTMDGVSQTGIVGCASIDEYLNNKIKKHELTRADKEADRIHHVDTCDANTGPIFLTYREEAKINEIIDNWVNNHEPEYDFVSEDEIGHTVWVINDEKAICELKKAFASVEDLYIADGHHRAASAVKVGQLRRQQNPGYTGEEEFNFFLAVFFPSNVLRVFDYNRVVKDFNGNTQEEFLLKIAQAFFIGEHKGNEPYRPEKAHQFGLYMNKKWYRLELRPEMLDENDVIKSLDVSILQDNVLGPILGIEDPRTDKRIDFIGGIRGLRELERRANDDMQIAFSMYPTSMDDLMAVADAGLVMPPKSTWFEPKLRSGLFIHKLK